MCSSQILIYKYQNRIIGSWLLTWFYGNIVYFIVEYITNHPVCRIDGISQCFYDTSSLFCFFVLHIIFSKKNIIKLKTIPMPRINIIETTPPILIGLNLFSDGSNSMLIRDRRCFIIPTSLNFRKLKKRYILLEAMIYLNLDNDLKKEILHFGTITITSITGKKIYE